MALLSTVSRSNWKLEMLVFVEGGKPELLEKNSRSRDENQQQTQFNPQMTPRPGIEPRPVGGVCSHYCAIPAVPGLSYASINEAIAGGGRVGWGVVIM